uniref:Uncharacterized protein n=1 Tax=Glossina palpalis gambiensis TaxID=67801 RepID=A0A1B0BDN8_9MUSC
MTLKRTPLHAAEMRRLIEKYQESERIKNSSSSSLLNIITDSDQRTVLNNSKVQAAFLRRNYVKKILEVIDSPHSVLGAVASFFCASTIELFRSGFLEYLRTKMK